MWCGREMGREVDVFSSHISKTAALFSGLKELLLKIEARRTFFNLCFEETFQLSTLILQQQ